MQSKLESSSDKATWEPLFSKDDKVFIRSVDAFQDYIVIGERRDGLPGLPFFARQIRSNGALSSEPVYSAQLVSANYEYATSTIRYSYTSLAP